MALEVAAVEVVVVEMADFLNQKVEEEVEVALDLVSRMHQKLMVVVAVAVAAVAVMRVAHGNQEEAAAVVAVAEAPADVTTWEHFRPAVQLVSIWHRLVVVAGAKAAEPEVVCRTFVSLD